MHDDDEPQTSAEQDAWAEIAGNLRDELLKRSRLAPVMDLASMNAFAVVCANVRALEVNAAVHDLAVAASEENLCRVIDREDD